MKKLTLPCFSLLAWGLLLQGCSPSSDSPGSSSGTGEGSESVSLPEGAAMLQIKWPVGNHYVQRMDLRQKSSTKLPQRPEPVKQDVLMSQEYGITVMEELEPAGRELDMEYMFVSLDVNMNDRPVLSFDSGGESLSGPEDPMATLFRNMVGMRLTLLLDESNLVESVVGLDEFLTKIAKTSPPRSREIMTNVFGEDTFKQMVELGRGLPSYPVQPGDTWSATNEIVSGPMGKLKMNLDYTFEKWEAREGRACAVLQFEGTLESSGGGGIGPMGLKMQLESGTMTGRTWFDPDLGTPVETDADQEMQMLMTANIPRIGDKGGGTRTFSTHLRQDIVMKLVEFSGN
jgi:hypothetical protein